MNLHAINARFGDCLLLEYGDDDPKYILIDGGPDQVYDNYLKKELKRIVKSGKLQAVIISHVDNDHVVGILDFFADLKAQRDTGKRPFMQVKELWLNSFDQTIDHSQELSRRLEAVMGVQGMQFQQHALIAVQGIKEAHQLAGVALDLGIPLNEKTPDGFFSVENNREVIKFGKLRFTIVGPTAANLEELKKEWEKWVEKNEVRIANGDFDLTANADRSVPNLSSIITLVKEGANTILLTGDCRADHLLQGLEERKLLKNGKLHVNLLKVQHHGSERNATRKFFEDVTADTYLISADGTYNNPDVKTLEWIITVARDQKRKIRIVVTNPTNSTDAILKQYPPAAYGYKLGFIATGKRSIKLAFK